MCGEILEGRNESGAIPTRKEKSGNWIIGVGEPIRKEDVGKRGVGGTCDKSN